jgi:hypothetical protein
MLNDGLSGSDGKKGSGIGYVRMRFDENDLSHNNMK